MKKGATPITKERFVVMDKNTGKIATTKQGKEFSSFAQATDVADELEITTTPALTLEMLRTGGPFGSR